MVETLFDLRLRLRQEAFRIFRVRAPQHAEAGFVLDEVAEGNRRRLGIEAQRVLALGGAARIVAEQRPVTAVDGQLLLLMVERHVIAVRDAR